MSKVPLRIEWTFLEEERAGSTIEPILEAGELARPELLLPGSVLDELATAERVPSTASRVELRLAALVVVLFLLLAGARAWYR
jgi:hypothetical protein